MMMHESLATRVIMEIGGCFILGNSKQFHKISRTILEKIIPPIHSVVMLGFIFTLGGLHASDFRHGPGKNPG